MTDPTSPVLPPLRAQAELEKPLTEIEKAELVCVIQDVLKPEGVTLLRRLMWQVDRHPAVLLAVQRAERERCEQALHDVGEAMSPRQAIAALRSQEGQ